MKKANAKFRRKLLLRLMRGYTNADIPYYSRLRYVLGLPRRTPKLSVLILQWKPNQTLEDFVAVHHALGQTIRIDLKPRTT